MADVYIKKSAAHRAVLHNEGQAAVAAIEAIKPEDVAPVVHSDWEPVALGDMRCKHCGGVYSVCGGLLGDYNYCPGCGAIMDGGKNGE